MMMPVCDGCGVIITGESMYSFVDTRTVAGEESMFAIHAHLARPNVSPNAAEKIANDKCIYQAYMNVSMRESLFAVRGLRS